jgi:hypothetical protein
MFYVIECTGMSNSFFSNLLCSAEKGNLGVPQLPGQGCSFHSFRTNTYKLSFMETPSGIKVRCSYIYVSYISILDSYGHSHCLMPTLALHRKSLLLGFCTFIHWLM